MLSRSHKLDAVIVNAISDAQVIQESPMSSGNPSLEIEPTHLESMELTDLHILVECPMLLESDSGDFAVYNSRCDTATDISNEANYHSGSSHDRIEVLQQLIDIKVRIYLSLTLCVLLR